MNNDFLLRSALHANAAFSATTGLAMAALPNSVGSLIGLQNPFPLTIVGLGLIVYSAYLLVLARGGKLMVLSLIATFGDLAWTLGTVLLFAFAPGVFSIAGWGVAFLVAIIVSLFAALQLGGIRHHFLNRTSKTGDRYQICFAIPVSVPEDSIWKAVRDVGSIHRFAPSLLSSDVTAKTDHQCMTRTCTDIKNQRWTELIQIDEAQKQLTIRFETSDLDFPFPTTSMSGGWRVLQGSDASQTTVRVWWSFSLRQEWAASILLPLFELGLKLQMRVIVTNMETTIGPQQSSITPSKKSVIAIGGC